ncbi:hypothetical protein ACUDCK_29635 (plasmid) [Achromobacter sp. CF-sbj1-Ac2-l]|jgi:hypothetical protein|uniref:hypothetical protein n=1 Tax=Achromobacter TaxID=222 RepID=UPI003BA35A50
MNQTSDPKEWEEEVTQLIEQLGAERPAAQAAVRANEMALNALWLDCASPATAAVTVYLKPAEALAGIQRQAKSREFALADDAVYFAQPYLADISDRICMRQLIERAVIRRAILDLLAMRCEDGPAYAISVFDGEETVVADSRDLATIMAAIMSTDEEALVVRRLRAGSKPAYAGEISLVHGNDGWDVIADYSTVLDGHLANANALAEAFGDLVA